MPGPDRRPKGPKKFGAGGGSFSARNKGPRQTLGRGQRQITLPAGLRIVFEDRDVIVIDKPHGLLTVEAPGAKKRYSVFDTLKALARTRGGRDARVFVIHRLDQEASGLLVFAKTEHAYTWLKEDFRARRVHRLYHAVVEGELLPGAGDDAAGTIQSMIRELSNGTVESLPATSSPGHSLGDQGTDAARLAITHYRVLARGNGRSLAQIRLETGRKHQIRVHMASTGHPLTGDPRYGKAGGPLGRLGLHATELGFRHPTTGEMVKFSSPAPPTFWTCVGKDAPREREARVVTAPTESLVRERKAEGSWDHVAGWYDNLIDDKGSDLYASVILPGTLGLLQPQRQERVLDIACGQGVLCRSLAALGARVTGVDGSPQLIDAARSRTPGIEYAVGDARDLAPLGLKSFDAAACVMALMNIDPLEPALRSIASCIRPGGRFVAVILHPAFRSPGQTSWGFDQGGSQGAASDRGRPGQGAYRGRQSDAQHRTVHQYRRIDGYLSHGTREIVMNPGEVASGQEPVVTLTYHRPLQTYVKMLVAAGLLIDSIEEWPSSRLSQPGPRAAEENRARREIPLFLAIRATKLSPVG